MPRIAIVSLLVAALLSGCGGAEPPGRRPRGAGGHQRVRLRLRPADRERRRERPPATRRIRSVPACGAELFVSGGRTCSPAITKGLTAVFSVPLSLDRAPTRLGSAHMFVASAADGRVWRAGSGCDRRRVVQRSAMRASARRRDLRQRGDRVLGAAAVVLLDRVLGEHAHLGHGRIAGGAADPEQLHPQRARGAAARRPVARAAAIVGGRRRAARPRGRRRAARRAQGARPPAAPARRRPRPCRAP